MIICFGDVDSLMNWNCSVTIPCQVLGSGDITAASEGPGPATGQDVASSSVSVMRLAAAHLLSLAAGVRWAEHGGGAETFIRDQFLEDCLGPAAARGREEVAGVKARCSAQSQKTTNPTTSTSTTTTTTTTTTTASPMTVTSPRWSWITPQLQYPTLPPFHLINTLQFYPRPGGGLEQVM